MKLIFLLSTLVLLLSASSYERGKSIYFQNGCSGCHGIEAEGSGRNPKLANQLQNNLINKLKRFQQGKSNSQNGEIMFEFARRLNTQEMKDISNFLSNHTKDTSTKYDISDDILGSVD